jgi:hypothetical protein
MRPRSFLDLAREAALSNTEAHWRGVVIHAYYALFLECRDALVRWGRSVPQRDAHGQVRLTFVYSRDQQIKDIGTALDELSPARAHASYMMSPGPLFSSSSQPLRLLQRATAALALLDAIDADPARRGAAVASLPP